MKIENIYTSVACNRKPTCLDWGNNGLIVYGGGCSLCLFDPNFDGSAKIVKTFVKHEKPVNCVKWIRNGSGSEFVSGGADGVAILWSYANDYVSYFILKGHSNAVYLVDAIKYKNEIIVATASSDSSVKLWSAMDNSGECFQTISVESGFCLALAMSVLPGYNKIVVAQANDNNDILLWVQNESTGLKIFQKLHVLKGHEDWVRGLDFINVEENDLMLCSSSQDTFIRLWKISPRIEANESALQVEKTQGNDEIKIEEKLFSVINDDSHKICVAICVESVLQGHEGWVYSVQWMKDAEGGMKLLSASMDKTIIVWEYNSDIGVWVEKHRLGEVGGNSLGFFGARFSADAKSIIGHSFQGGLHIWKQAENDINSWQPSIMVGGHFNEVRDLCWEPNGEFLFTVSADQTTRIHAPFRRGNGSTCETWHELARPQIHGYDMQTIAAVSRYKFASGGEEKIIRMFQTTADFIQNFRNVCNISADSDLEGDKLLKSLPQGASVPSLGLSNKAVYDNNGEESQKKHVKDEYPENYYVHMTLKTPPQEEMLMQNTLWPEIHKLYGHGFEIFSLAASNDSKMLASSCKATATEHAQIIVWDTTTGKQVQKLSSHQLTVTQLKFSCDNKYLLSVSRDRTWTVFRNTSAEGIDFALEAKSDKTNGIHTRIIWSCDWSHDSKMFATSSRDGKLILWTKDEVEKNNSLKKWSALKCFEIPNQSVTAVCFATRFLDESNPTYLIAAGFENGHIQVYKFSSEFEHLGTIEQDYAHHSTVRKLQFNANRHKWLLASCGDDNFVRIIELVP